MDEKNTMRYELQVKIGRSYCYVTAAATISELKQEATELGAEYRIYDAEAYMHRPLKVTISECLLSGKWTKA